MVPMPPACLGVNLNILTVLSLAIISLVGCAQKLDPPAANPPSAPSAASKQPAAAQPSSVVASGQFVDGEHPTTGTVRLVENGSRRSLELDQDFATSTSGPDLVVVLHRSADVIGSTTPPAFPIKQGDYVVIAPLKDYTGAQNYDLPDGLDLGDFKSVAIWCRRFNATFGAAKLQ